MKGRLNLFVAMGEITDISELRETGNGKPVINFFITISESNGENIVQTKLYCGTFGKNAEFVNGIIENRIFVIHGKVRLKQGKPYILVDSIQG